MKKPVVLIIRDGWGYRVEKEMNTIANGDVKFTNYLMQTYPNILLDASGKAVGLPQGYQGNSEVGHMTIGSGRIIFQSLEKINYSIEDGTFFNNAAFLGAINNAKQNNTKLHLIGLLQTEGVHSHMNHLFALLDLCKKNNFTNVYIHVITDGRDSPPKEAINKLNQLNDKLEELGFGKIVTLSGRYYTMDRDKRWERTKKAYDCLVHGNCDEFENPKTQIEKNYLNDETDEFQIPRKLKGYDGIKPHDSIIFYNFRTDRTRQLTKAIVEKEFEGEGVNIEGFGDWHRTPLDVYYVAMTQFYTPMNAHVAFEEVSLANLLGEVISKHNLKQLRISETEKYAHVTFFFNGQIEKPFEGEERILIFSPKVATYDLKPEMSVYEIADKLVEQLDKDIYDFAVTNLVNGDMVGHTGIMSACLKAVHAVDECVEKIVKKVLEKDGIALVFADHGNIEDKTEQWKTSHTMNPVPFIFVSNKGKEIKLVERGSLRDIAPTVLDIYGIEKPKEMTGNSLIRH